MKNGKEIRGLLEAVKPQMVTDIESCFGDMIWSRENNYTPQDRDLHLMFDIINKGVFDNKLDRGVNKLVLSEDFVRSGPPKYRGLEHALAAFGAGCVKGQPTEIIMIKHRQKDNFFIIFSSLIHEMIHMYDYQFGPWHQQLERFGATGNYNLNISPPGLPPPRTPEQRMLSNILNATRIGLHPSQLPDEILSKIQNPTSYIWPRQYGFPAEPTSTIDKNTGKRIPSARPLPQKYLMSALSGFYDVHGSFFRSFADKANAMGFGISDVFTGSPEEIAMRKVFENEKKPKNVAEVLKSMLKSKDPISAVYENDENWYVEIW